MDWLHFQINVKIFMLLPKYDRHALNMIPIADRDKWFTTSTINPINEQPLSEFMILAPSTHSTASLV